MSEVSLAETAGMKVREWYVTYHDRPPAEHWIYRPLKPGFRHVELARPIYYGDGPNDVGWLLLLPTYEMLEVELCADPRPPWVRAPNATVQKVTAMRPLYSVRSWWDIGPTTCVEVAKMALGIRDFFVRTPWQLYNYIQRRDCIVRS